MFNRRGRDILRNHEKKGYIAPEEDRADLQTGLKGRENSRENSEQCSNE